MRSSYLALHMAAALKAARAGEHIVIINANNFAAIQGVIHDHKTVDDFNPPPIIKLAQPKPLPYYHHKRRF